jgi:hypothetical protein
MPVSQFRMPKAGMFDAGGRLTKAGHKFLTGVETAVRAKSGTASTAEEFLTPGNSAVLTSGLWEAMAPEPTSLHDVFTPDLGHRLDYDITLTGVTVMRLPINVPLPALPFFSVLFRQDAVGGRILQFDGAFQGEGIGILDSGRDATLCGFKMLTATSWTGWAIKLLEFEV